MSGRYSPDAPSIVGASAGAPQRPTQPQRLTQSRAERIASQHPGKIIPPTFDGDVEVSIGRYGFGVPQGSRVVRHKTAPIAYLLTKAGGVHLLTERGELEIDDAMRQWIRSAHFPRP